MREQQLIDDCTAGFPFVCTGAKTTATDGAVTCECGNATLGDASEPSLGYIIVASTLMTVVLLGASAAINLLAVALHLQGEDVSIFTTSMTLISVVLTTRHVIVPRWPNSLFARIYKASIW